LRVGTWEDGVILLSRPGATASYDPAVRVLGSAWFMFLAVACGAAVLADSRGMGLVSFGPAEWIACIARGCLVLFYLVLWWLMLLRPSPIARSDGWLPSLIALVGTYLPWTIPLFASSDSSAGRDFASAVFLLAGAGLMIVVIVHLGRSFSIVPQARHLVTSGPYAIVRNSALPGRRDRTARNAAAVLVAGDVGRAAGARRASAAAHLLRGGPAAAQLRRLRAVCANDASSCSLHLVKLFAE
jgi:protein-S-isoprenylcysteine O-methyltransferase Ste14